MRILHLIDPAAGDEGLLACAAATRAIAGANHHVWLIGSDNLERRAWSLGLLTADRVVPRQPSRFGRDATALALVRLRAARESGAARADLVQCWSLDALHLARNVFGSGPGSPARCAVIPRPPRTAQRSTPSDSDLATGREVLVAYDHATRRALAGVISRDGPAAAPRWLPAIRHLSAPILPHDALHHADRAAIRRALDIPLEESVVALLADPPVLADAQRLSFAMGVLRALGHRATLLVPRGARHDRRAAAYVAAHARRWGLVFADLPIWDLAAAADIGVIDAPPSPTTPPAPTCGPAGLAAALALGLPVATFPGVFEDSHAPWPLLAAPAGLIGRIAVPIAAYLETPAFRTEHAAVMRAYLDRARAASDFSRTLAAIWSEQLNVPSSDVGLPLVR